MKKMISMILALLILLSLSVPAWAEATAATENAVSAVIDSLVELLP